MAQSNQILAVSDLHEGILNYLVTHPAVSRLEVAEAFGVTRCWLSTIIHSDVFQAKLRERQDEVFTEAIVAPIEQKLLGAAHMAAERMMELLPNTGDLREVSGAMDTALKNLGYGQRSTATINADQVNVVQVSSESLSRARDLVGAARAAQAEDIMEGEPLEQKRLERDDVSEIREPGGSLLVEASETPALPGASKITDTSLPAWADL